MQAASAILAACGGFLLAVLWMDLMFDVQVLRSRRREAELPEPVLASIAGYYRRVTTDASPMGHLVALVMAITLFTLAVQWVGGHAPRWRTLTSLVLCGGPILLAIGRVVPNAVRLGSRKDPALRQSALARSICRDHLLCFAGILAFVVLQCLALGGVAVGARAAVSAEPPCATPVAASDGWEVATPSAAGLDARALCAALAEIDRGAANIHGVIVERGGRLVAELYRAGPDRPIDVHYGLGTPFAPDVQFGRDALHDVRSVSKSVVGLLVGIAHQKGEIPDLDAPALGFFPELADLRTPERDAITLAHLLTMSSGLSWSEWGRGPITSDETRLFWKSAPVRFVFDRPQASPPGARFDYNGGGTATLAEVMTRVSGKPIDELARARLFEPLGITHWTWAVDLRGRPLAFAGLRMRPRDMAKLGRLVLARGRWHGRQIVSEAWVAQSLRSQIATGLRIPPQVEGELGYGFQWWTGSIPWKGGTLGWSAALGNGGQRIFVVPTLDLTVVITAGAYGSPEIARPVGDLFAKIVAAAIE